MKCYDATAFGKIPNAIAPLFEVSDGQSFFNLTTWFQLVAEFDFGTGNQVKLAVDDSGRVALPIMQSTSTGALYSCTNLYTCEYNILGAAGEIDAIRGIARDIPASFEHPSYIQLQGLDPNGPSFSALEGGFRDAGLIVKPFFGWGIWFERPNGVTFDRYLEKRPSILRNTWRRKSTMLEKTSRARFRLFEQGNEIAPFLEAYESVERRSWKKPEPLANFIPSLIRMLAEEGSLRMGVLEIDGVPAAAQFWIVWRGRATIFKLVYAEELSRFSPGTLLTMQMMQHVLETVQPFEIDFGRGDDAYKKLWLGSRRERWGIEAANPRTVRGLPAAARIGARLARDYVKSRFGFSHRGVSVDAKQRFYVL